MDNMIFAQSIARIRFLETKMLDKAKIEALVEANEFSDVIRMLQDSQYGEYVNMPSYESGLKKALEDFYADIYKMIPVKQIMDILKARYDGHNIKALIKGKYSDTDVDSILIDTGTIPLQSLAAMIKEENFRDMPKTLRKYVEISIENYKNFQDPQNIDITIDNGIYSYMLEICADSGTEYTEKIVKLMIDIINIKSFIRVKAQQRDRDFLMKVFIKGGNLDFDIFGNNLNDSLENFSNKIMHTDYFKWVKEGLSEYIKNGDLGSIEKYADNFIIEYIKKTKLVSFGPEPVIAYVLARENEIKAVRIILTGKKNGVRPDTIRERLRDLYV